MTTEIKYGVLHNRKTAGTALQAVINEQRQRTPQMNVTYFDHAMTFGKLITTQPNLQAIFFVRDPISRFVSGFYSRLRQGAPRYFYPWSRGEAKAFAYFKTPNELAESISSWNPYRRYRALHAMKSIAHVKHTYIDFLGTVDFLKQHADRIAYIGHQPDFAADLVNIRALLNIDDDIAPPADEKGAHRNPAHLDSNLSESALLNLSNWYIKDYAVFAWCLNQRKIMMKKQPSNLIKEEI